MTFESLTKKLVAHAKKATGAFAKKHGDVVVSAFAFDADPYNEYFACCFDDGTGSSVGDFRHHLFHELELPVHAQLPKGGAPPWKGKDGYIEHHMRPVLVEACKAIASARILERVNGASKIRVGYAYPSEKLRVVATVKGVRREATKPLPAKATKAPKDVRLTDDELHALLAKPDAFEQLAFVFKPARMRHPKLWADAFDVMLALAETPKRFDDRWVDRAISLLGVDSVRNSAIFVLGASGQRRALDALYAAAKKEDDAKAATELAERGDPRASPFLTAVLLDRTQQREAGWVLEALGKCGDAGAIESIEKWVASRRKADPDVRFAQKVIAGLSKGKKKRR
jgi:hypothetical protein